MAVAFNNYFTMYTRYQGSVVISSLILLVVVTILLGLGTWQLNRMTEKQDYLADITAKMQQPVLSLQDAYQNRKANQNTPVLITGDINPNHIWYLDNQPFDSNIGYHVYAPVVTSIGTILVNFGWLKAPGSRSEWPDVDLPLRLQTEPGVVTTPSNNPFIDDSMFETYYKGEQTQFRVQAINPTQSSSLANLQLLPFTLTLTQQSKQFARQWKPVVMPPEKHLGYAIQWFGLALAALIIGGIAISKAGKKHD